MLPNLTRYLLYDFSPSGILTIHFDEIYKLALEEKSCIFIAKLMYVEFNYINPKSMQIWFNVKQGHDEAVWS